VLTEGKPWPVEVRAPARSAAPVFRVPGDQSSQYASSLLLGCAALFLRERRPWRVEILGTLTSAGYLELTVSWLRRFGFTVNERTGHFEVADYQAPEQTPSMPGDWSSLGYLLLLSWRTGGSVERADLGNAHPDQALVRLVERAGLRAEAGPDSKLRLVGEARDGLVASGKECPDLLPTLAALACVLPRPSTLTDVSILRVKESDRLEGIRALVDAVGGKTVLDGETLTIHPPTTPPRHFAMDSRGDHRMAMVAATLSALCGARLQLTGPECVEKSFPGFWRQMELTGARLS
jgi:3-phosphoshikimate 1-carboxyvinyltransferase